MMDLFWNIVVSAPVLAALLVIFIASFLLAHVPLIARIFPALVPYQHLALLAQVGSGALFAFTLGFGAADDRAETQRLRTELLWKRVELENQEATAKDADQLLKEAKADAALAKGQLNEWREKYGDGPDARCAFDPQYLDWLHNRRRQPRGAKPR